MLIIEYRIENIAVGDDANEVLNRVGRDGWELTQITYTNTANTFMYIFMRINPDQQSYQLTIEDVISRPKSSFLRRWYKRSFFKRWYRNIKK